MVRIIIKGGVWKNTEDEVLKAAIAKYGKNQWARISSLLVRKTPKQCKARWYEWLDPSIKKTEWSKTEDEKLLHLAKLMPTQWRTIAPIVGRTATQCLERYQKLLDEAEAKENEEMGLAGPDDHGPSADDVRKLRPGEIDPDPETKPARPDPIDMDEDEKEMLSEARARLANTQGKKAKRKARERQLEEARRLAVLQKKRELKAAGIIMRHKSKKKGMDYNADIPFEKKAAAGFYDTSDEQARIMDAPIGQSLRRLENKRKPDPEEEERKKRQKRGKEGENQHNTKFVAARDAQIQKLKEAESMSKRRSLALPAPQVGESELEEIVKIGQAGEDARSLVAGGAESSGRLMTEYEGLERARMARTPRTAPREDNIMLEARNLRNMTVQQTPLLGDQNTPLHTSAGTGFEGATPRTQVAFTPNPLATPRNGDIGEDLGAVGATPLRTPMRDNLNINSDASAFIGDTPRNERARASAAKRSLQNGFMNLPKPENNFELLMPEDEDKDDAGGVALSEEDAEERDARIRRAQEEERLKALARRSQVVQRSLPRPPNVSIDRMMEQLNLGDDEDDLASARQLVNAEMAAILKHDSLVHPLPGTSTPGGTPSSYEMVDDLFILAAKNQVHLELAQASGFPDATEEQIRQSLIAMVDLSALDDSITWSKTRSSLVLDAEKGRYVPVDSLTPEQRVAGYSALLSDARETMGKEAGKASKMEKKLAVTLGGYQARATAIAQRITSAFTELESTKVDLEAFSRLRDNENATGPARVTALREEVERLEAQERRLQGRYAELEQERRDAQAHFEAMEERVMQEAEALNEAALAEIDA